MLHLRRVIPLDFYELVLQLSDGSYRLFSPAKNSLYEKYSFLAYPHKLKALRFSSDGITWYNGVHFTLDFLLQHSVTKEKSELNNWLTIGSKNQAPTDQDAHHHEFYVAVRPFTPETPIVTGESIGGGHADRGGCSTLSVSQLLAQNDWEIHFGKSDATWAIPLIKAYADQPELLIGSLVENAIRRSEPEP